MLQIVVFSLIIAQLFLIFNQILKTIFGHIVECFVQMLQIENNLKPKNSESNINCQFIVNDV